MRRGFAAILLVGLIALFAILGTTIYLKQNNKLTAFNPPANQSALQSSPAPTPDGTENHAENHTQTFGEITFDLPQGWKVISQDSYSGELRLIQVISSELSPENYSSYDIYGQNGGLELNVHRNKDTTGQNINCQPDKEVKSVTSVKCLKVGDKNASVIRDDYEGHFLSYVFTHRGFEYIFSFATKDMNEEQKYVLQIEFILKSIKLL